MELLPTAPLSAGLKCFLHPQGVRALVEEQELEESLIPHTESWELVARNTQGAVSLGSTCRGCPWNVPGHPLIPWGASVGACSGVRPPSAPGVPMGRAETSWLCVSLLWVRPESLAAATGTLTLCFGNILRVPVIFPPFSYLCAPLAQPCPIQCPAQLLLCSH